MHRIDIFKGFVVLLAVTGLCFPQPLLAAVTNPTPVVTDVALADDGMLLGQVVDDQGAAMAGVQVTLQDQFQLGGITMTNEEGYFRVQGLHGGIYQVVAAGGQGSFRLWTPGTAPPLAEQGALIVAGSEIERGQCVEPLLSWLANPWMLAAVVAASVAVPVAIHNAQDDEPASP